MRNPSTKDSNIHPWFEKWLRDKPGFWFFQIAGWTIFLILEYFQFYRRIDSLYDFLRLGLSLMAGFVVSLLLRVVYRKFYESDFSGNIIATPVLILLMSLAGGLVWSFINIYGLLPFWNWIIRTKSLEINIISFFSFSRNLIFLSFPLVIWSSLYFVIKYWIELLAERERGVMHLLSAKTSQLTMLRYQLNPHFLFNSLSSIQALVYDDPENADRMISRLSEYLRFTLYDKDRLFISLNEEVSIVGKYLSLEKTRFPDRLHYEIHVSDEAANIEVVAFILHPLVENAVKYGLLTATEKLLIEINGFIKDGSLFIKVMDSGSWVEKTEPGTGLENVRSRLESAYEGRYSLDIDKQSDHVIITVEIVLQDG